MLPMRHIVTAAVRESQLLVYASVTMAAMLLGGRGVNGWGPAAAIADSATTITPEENSPFLRPAMTCPDEVERLTLGLLRDLPGYANRVARRHLGTAQDGTGFGTVIVAGRAEFEPLSLDPLAFITDEAVLDTVQQVFFTTLERRYTDTEAVMLEQYHWLFLVPTETGWRLTLMFSRTAVDDATARPPTPTQESSDGIVGQAVQLWLRDCRAGALFPIESAPEELLRRR